MISSQLDPNMSDWLKEQMEQRELRFLNAVRESIYHENIQYVDVNDIGTGVIGFSRKQGTLFSTFIQMMEDQGWKIKFLSLDSPTIFFKEVQ